MKEEDLYFGSAKLMAQSQAELQYPNHNSSLLAPLDIDTDLT